MTASTKDEFKEQVQEFISPCISDKPLLFEVFVSTENEIEGDQINDFKSPGIKGLIRSAIGDDLYSDLKKFIKGENLGHMSVDQGHN